MTWFLKFSKGKARLQKVPGLTLEEHHRAERYQISQLTFPDDYIYIYIYVILRYMILKVAHTSRRTKMQISAWMDCNKMSLVTLRRAVSELCASVGKDKYPTIPYFVSFPPLSFFSASPGSPLIFPDGLFTLHSLCLDSRKSSLYGTLGHDCVPLGRRSTHWKLIGTLGSLGSSNLALPNRPQSQKKKKRVMV